MIPDLISYRISVSNVSTKKLNYFKHLLISYVFRTIEYMSPPTGESHLCFLLNYNKIIDFFKLLLRLKRKNLPTIEILYNIYLDFFLAPLIG